MKCELWACDKFVTCPVTAGGTSCPLTQVKINMSKKKMDSWHQIIIFCVAQLSDWVCCLSLSMVLENLSTQRAVNSKMIIKD